VAGLISICFAKQECVLQHLERTQWVDAVRELDLH